MPRLGSHLNMNGSRCSPEKQVLLKFFACDQFDLSRESLKPAQVMMVAVPRNHHYRTREYIRNTRAHTRGFARSV